MEAQQMILKPITLKHKLILSPGVWNDVEYTELEIQKAFHNTDWSDKKFTSLYLDHQDTKGLNGSGAGVGNWVGFVKNVTLENSAIYGDLEIWNPMIAAYLSQAKAKFGISATLAGRENRTLGRMEDFHIESSSIVTDPACRPAMINLSADRIEMIADKDVKVVTMESETPSSEDIVELEMAARRRSEAESGKLNEDVLEFLRGNPNPTDDDVHKFVEGKGLDPHNIEPEFYKIATLVANLKHGNDDDSKFDAGELSDGIEIEKEHSDNPAVAKMIAKAHLAEFPNYYTALKQMEQELQNIHSKKSLSEEKELACSGSPHEAHTLEPVKMEKPKKKEELGEIHDTYVDGHSIFIKQEGKSLSEEELGAKFERQVQHIKDSLRKTHPDWSEEKIKQVAYATANKMKDLSLEISDAEITSLSEEAEKENSEKLKGGKRIPEKMENESAKVEELATSEVPETKELEKKSEPEKPEKEKEGKEDKEEMSSDAILGKIKEMSAEELASYAEFTKAYLSENKDASAKEVTLAYEKSLSEKAPVKELSANDLLAAMDSRIATLKELDSNKKVQELETQVKELSAKVKEPDRKTLSVAFESNSQDSNLGMLSFLQHRIN